MAEVDGRYRLLADRSRAASSTSVSSVQSVRRHGIGPELRDRAPRRQRQRDRAERLHGRAGTDLRQAVPGRDVHACAVRRGAGPVRIASNATDNLSRRRQAAGMPDPSATIEPVAGMSPRPTRSRSSRSWRDRHPPTAPSSRPATLLADLTARQRRAVTWGEGPCSWWPAPGTGKTTVLTGGSRGSLRSSGRAPRRSWP